MNNLCSDDFVKLPIPACGPVTGTIRSITMPKLNAYLEVIGTVNHDIKPVVTTNNNNTMPVVTKPAVHDASIIPPDRMHSMQVYYQQLKTKYPHMKAGRLARKTAEHFKIKLV